MTNWRHRPIRRILLRQCGACRMAMKSPPIWDEMIARNHTAAHPIRGLGQRGSHRHDGQKPARDDRREWLVVRVPRGSKKERTPTRNGRHDGRPSTFGIRAKSLRAPSSQYHPCLTDGGRLRGRRAWLRPHDDLTHCGPWWDAPIALSCAHAPSQFGTLL